VRLFPKMPELAGTHYYNPNWCYQNELKRNASIGRTNQPVIILSHDFRINNNKTLTTAAGNYRLQESGSGIYLYAVVGSPVYAMGSILEIDAAGSGMLISYNGILN
jgi:hypothetical protein